MAHHGAEPLSEKLSLAWIGSVELLLLGKKKYIFISDWPSLNVTARWFVQSSFKIFVRALRAKVSGNIENKNISPHSDNEFIKNRDTPPNSLSSVYMTTIFMHQWHKLKMRGKETILTEVNKRKPVDWDVKIFRFCLVYKSATNGQEVILRKVSRQSPCFYTNTNFLKQWNSAYSILIF